MDSFSSSSTQPMTDFELKMKVQVKEIRSLVSRYGAKVPSTFTLWSPPCAGSSFGSSSVRDQGQGRSISIRDHSNNGHHGHDGVIEDSSQLNLQLLFLCMEESPEITLFATTIPNHGEYVLLISSNLCILCK